MNTKIATVLTALALQGWLVSAMAEDYELLQEKARILVDQAKEFYADSAKPDSFVHGAAFQYYFKLMVSTGTNILARSKSPSTEKLLRSYIDRIGKDYGAYTKVNTSLDMADATGKHRGHTGDRQRTKRRINAEKLGDKELAAAIKRWEAFYAEIKRKSR